MKIAEIQPQLYAHFSTIVQQGKLSHAYLFSGGFGANELALWLSQAIFCETPENALPCGKCRACRLVAEENFTDLHIVVPDGQTIKIAQIRELTQVFSESGYEGNRQVILIREAEKMHPNAANALLKSIEEPESDVTVFLLTDNENLILPTIISRTQVINFPKNVHYLQDFLEKNGVLKTQAELLAELCNGTEEALEMAQEHWFTEGLKRLQEFVKKLKTSADEAFLYLSALTEIFDDKDKQNRAFELLLQLLNQEKMTQDIQKTFKAMKMWKSNVRFEMCLTYVTIGEK